MKQMFAKISSKYNPVLSEPYPETTENIDALFQAVKNQNYSIISNLLREKKVNSSTVNYTDVSRPSLLIECCKRSDKKLLQIMIKIEKEQLKSSYEDVHGHRAVWYAIENNFLIGIQDLLEHKLIDPNLYDTKTSFTPILQGIERKRTEIVEAFIRAGADPNLPPRNPAHRGLTPLILSIVNGNDEISRFLINSLCSLNQYVEDGYTALHYSVLMSRHPTIISLLKAGARTNVRSIYGVTPMTLAILCDDPYSVKILIEHGYPITRTYPWNEYPFEHAVKIHAEGSAMMIAYLGIELKIKQGNRSSNPLTMAASEGLINLMFLLINMQPQSINQHWIRKRQYPHALYRLKHVQTDLQRMFSNPFRLKQLCRAKISQTIGKFYTEKIIELKKTYPSLSDRHLEYLRYQDVMDPMKHFRPVGKRLAHFEVNGLEFYWDQRTLRYRKLYDDPNRDIKKDKARDEQPKSAIVRLTSVLLKRRQHQQARKQINETKSLTMSSYSSNTITRHTSVQLKSAHNAGRGILSKRHR
ncbi:unnamed protein product [Rotaria magnacalcarata]|uniref:SOCS box domain-containing protein n=4 Tax=Rotaria magnacalcarata TaxID=392030 RepID=A0A816QXZ9_9BILA|nr:unnamed protein product [Rotaria magnacalcarata]